MNAVVLKKGGSDTGGVLSFPTPLYISSSRGFRDRSM